MIPVPTREQQFAFQALQQALTEEKAFIRIDFKRLNRYNSPFFNPWENLLPLIAVVLISFAIMFTDNLIIGLSVLVFLIFLYNLLLPMFFHEILQLPIIFYHYIYVIKTPHDVILEYHFLSLPDK